MEVYLRLDRNERKKYEKLNSRTFFCSLRRTRILHVSKYIHHPIWTTRKTRIIARQFKFPWEGVQVRKKILTLSALPLLLAFIGGCGGSGHHTTPPPAEGPVVVTVSDQPPAGINVVSFQLTITGGCLLTSSEAGATSCTGVQNLFPVAPDTIQFANLGTPVASDVVSNTDVQAGTYTGVLLMFGTGTATVTVDPGQVFGDGTTTCDNSAGVTPLVCQLAPTVSTSTVTANFSSPVTLTSGTPVQIAIYLNVGSSLVNTTGTLSINPTATVTENSTVGTDGNLVDVSQVTGTVTAVTASSVTITDSATGESLTLNVPSTTVISNFPTSATCTTANTFACVQTGNVVTVGIGANGTTSLGLNATSIAGNPGFNSTTAFEATIVQTTPTVEAVITAVPSGNTDTLTVGQVVTLDASAATFSTSSSNTLPGQFLTSADFVVGQNVLIDASAFTAAAPPTLAIATADEDELLPTEINGTADDLASPNLTIAGMDSFFTGNNITVVDAQTGSFRTFNGTVANFGDITTGEPLSFDGFLENNPATPGTPVFMTTNIFGAQATAAVTKTSKK